MKRAPITLHRFGRNVDLTALFNRLPDEIVLDIASRDFDAGSPDQCLCGWALRESLAQATQVDAGDVAIPGTDNYYGSPGVLSSDVIAPLIARFGGAYGDWAAVYWGVTNPKLMPDIEAAWTERVMKAAGVLT